MGSHQAIELIADDIIELEKRAEFNQLIGRETKDLSTKEWELVILGAGPAALNAALYAARKGIEVLLLTKDIGGQVITTNEIDNYLGKAETTGAELIYDFWDHISKYDVETVIGEEAVEIADKDNKKMIKTDNDKEYLTESVIIATGAEPRKLGLEKEDKFRGSGVSYCATCDGAFYKGDEIAVVGGGNVALEEADYLTQFGSKVYLIHRRSEFRGTEILSDRVKNNDKIEILWNNEVTEILGEDSLSGIVVENNKTGERKELSNVKGFFIAIGYDPRTELFEDDIELDEKKYIVTNRKQETNKEGIYAAGDVQDSSYRQVITSAAAGAKAAMEVNQYITSLKGDSVYV